jgi:general secretion pathway protein M
MIQERWQALSQREKTLVAAAAALIALLILWFVIIAPIRAAKTGGLAAYQDARQTYAVVQRAAARGAAQPAAASTDQPLRTVLAQTADQTGIVIDRYDIQADQVNLTVGNTDMGTLYRWLRLLSEQHGVTVAEGTVRPTGEEGSVTARLTVERT